MLKPLEMAHELLAEVINPEDVVVDATMGNGYDTLFLAMLQAEVYAFDIQKTALEMTEKRLNQAGILSDFLEEGRKELASHSTVHLIHSGHETVGRYVKKPVTAAIFNLGYLPKADKKLITRPETTLTALSALAKQLKVGGRIAVMVYYGHEGGEAEKTAVVNWVTSLPQECWEVMSYVPLNQIHTPPFLIVLEKRKEA